MAQEVVEIEGILESGAAALSHVISPLRCRCYRKAPSRVPLKDWKLTAGVRGNARMIDSEPRAPEGFEVWMLSRHGVIVA